MHLIAKNVPGYGMSESRCFPCSGISGRVVTSSPCATHGYYRLHSQVKIRSLKCTSREPSFVCKMSSGGHRRNPDFSRQNRNGFSRNRNRQNEERDSFEKAEDSDLSSKNGSLHSLSNTPKFQATALPGPREEEIVELFRKVQTQLRERAAVKEEKKIEALQGQGKESETVDSLLKLLRKHSVEQGKKKIKSGDFMLDQPEQNGPVNGKTSSSIFDSNSTMPDQTQNSVPSPLTRPLSNFRRKSPVPQVKFNGANSAEKIVNSVSHMNLGGKRQQNPVDTSPDPKHEPATEPEPEVESEPVDAYVEVSEDEDIDESANKEEPNINLGTLKLPELRAVAKSRGIKGFSKMKKGELLELLNEIR